MSEDPQPFLRVSFCRSTPDDTYSWPLLRLRTHGALPALPRVSSKWLNIYFPYLKHALSCSSCCDPQYLRPGRSKCLLRYKLHKEGVENNYLYPSSTCTHSQRSCSSVNVVILLQAGHPRDHTSIPGGGTEYFAPPNVQSNTRAHPTSCSMGTVGSVCFHQLVPDSDLSSPSSAKIKSEWSFTSTPPACPHGMHKDSFAYTLWICCPNLFHCNIKLQFVCRLHFCYTLRISGSVSCAILRVSKVPFCLTSHAVGHLFHFYSVHMHIFIRCVLCV